MRLTCFFIFFLKINPSLWSNPFLIDFPVKQELTNDDYLLIQEKLRAIDLNPLLQEDYQDIQSIEPQADYEKFFSRCTRGIYRTFINPEKGLFPVKTLSKINDGGDCCIVSAASCEAKYLERLHNQIEALQKVGWNGYHLCFFGALPNPSGREIRYAGVPAFKIFAMLEAQKLGFNKVLWMNAGLKPIQDLSGAFIWLEAKGSLLMFLPDQLSSFHAPYLSHKTRSLLKEATGTDVDDIHVCASVFGLLMNHPLTCSFVQQYYQFCEWGYPFISGCPEDTVLSAILFQKKFADWTSEENNFAFWFPFYFYRSNKPIQFTPLLE